MAELEIDFQVPRSTFTWALSHHKRSSWPIASSDRFKVFTPESALCCIANGYLGLPMRSGDALSKRQINLDLKIINAIALRNRRMVKRALPNPSLYKVKSYTEQPAPSPVTFKNLPPRIYNCILENLEKSHLGPYGDGCLTCYLRDLHSLSLTCRAWERAVRPKMYHKVHIHGPDSATQLKRYKSKRGSRLKLLRRTLRERRLLANIVHELVAPDLESFSMSNVKGGDAQQEFIDLIASVVMVCPNLEKLTGLTLPYCHYFDRLTYALSTRKKLKQHAWIIGENAEVAHKLLSHGGENHDAEHHDEYTFQFLSYHRSWNHLESLLIHSIEMKGRLGHDTYGRLFRSLPSLKHLSLSCLLPSDFNDNNLIDLPSLKSLRIERVPGVTEHGLSRFCSYPASRDIESFTLIEQNIYSLMLISKLLASLRCLRNFAISQTSVSPSMPDGDMVLQPLFASSTLKYLHWDIKSPNAILALNDLNSIATTESLSKSNSPNAHLAQSILNSGFPSLEKLRAPQDIDPLGALQCVCRPTPSGRIMVPEDRYSLPRSSRGSFPHNRRIQALPSGNHLTSARIRAQMLMEMRAREVESGMKVIVTDFSTPPLTPPPDDKSHATWSADREQTDKIASIITTDDQQSEAQSGSTEKRGIKVHEFTVPPYMGRITSESNSGGSLVAPSYSLVPDVPGSDAEGGLVNWKHFMISNQTYKFISAVAPPLPSIDTSFNRRSRSSSSLGSLEETNSPTSPTTPSLQFPRFSGLGSGGNSNSCSRYSKVPPQLAPQSPKKFHSTNTASPSLSPPSIMGQPYWLRGTCKGEWNRQHRGGKDWWQHTERERALNKKTSESITLDDLHLYP
ncbi:hypothetical protein KEM54_006620 [Ascosphaera aggregata]|nr:hypothetical protein KEM54_006620 [Ascosphaera aggregata]